MSDEPDTDPEPTVDEDDAAQRRRQGVNDTEQRYGQDESPA